MFLKTMTSREILFKILIPVFCVFAVAGAVLGALFGAGVLGKEEESIILRPPKQNIPAAPDTPGASEKPLLEADTNIYDLTYMDSMGGYQITGVKVETLDANLVLPSTYRREPVVEIGRNCFQEHTEIESVEIPNSVTSIGDWAFNGCSSLVSVTIEDGVTNIGAGAFSWCNNLVSITIGNSVTSIENQAFELCSSLRKITIPNSVTSIESGAFGACRNLVEVWNLSSLNIVAGSNSNGGVAQYALAVYTDASAPSKVSKDANGFLTFADAENGKYVLVGYEGSETNITLPDSISGQNYVIRDFAFCDNNDIISVTIPNGVTEIGACAFNGCSSLVSVTIETGVAKIGSSAFSWCNNLASITIPDSVITIEGSAFSYCPSLVSVTIGNGVTSIGRSAFHGSYKLSSVSFGEDINWSALSFGSYALASNNASVLVLVVNGTNQAAIETALTKLATLSGKSQCTIQIDPSLVGSISNTYGFAGIEAIQ